jgi:PHD/YefM family antitoxin component YafN of YafNO toxin-antitoxin module
MLDTVAEGRTVLITMHHVPHAVVISADRYAALVPTGPDLDALTAEFDELLARMQTQDVQTAIREAFRVSPDEMGQAALTAAQRI